MLGSYLVHTKEHHQHNEEALKAERLTHYMLLPPL